MITNVKLPSRLENCFFILGVSSIIHVSGVDVIGIVRTLDLHPHVEEHLLKLLVQRSKLSTIVKHIASALDISCGKKTSLLS